MAPSIVKKLAEAKKKKEPAVEETPVVEESNSLECLWCHKKSSYGDKLPICRLCERIGREEVTDAPTDTLIQMFGLVDIIKKYRRWAAEDTDMGRQQLKRLDEVARLALEANYPITLTSGGVDNKAFQDNLTEAFVIWMRESAGMKRDNDFNGILSDMITTFDPVGMTTSLVNITKHPEGSITVLLENIKSMLGVEKADTTVHDRVTIELPNLFAMISRDYAGCLACTLEGDPNAGS
jgi:hypothetical protein